MLPTSPHVTPLLQVAYSFLHSCGARRPCRAIDLGANAGWMTAAMLSMGAFVVSVCRLHRTADRPLYELSLIPAG